MARPIILSNNELQVGLSRHGEVSDVYFPYVGLENHTIGGNTRHRVGVWADGRVSWLSDDDWSCKFSYHHEALIGHIVAVNEQIGIMLEFDDAVDTDFNVLLRTIHVVNLQPETRDVRLFMHQAFIIGDSGSSTDTVQVLPDDNAVIHYRGRRVFAASGQIDGGRFFDQYAVGVFGREGREGTYRDADDGELSNSTAEHGRVDSTIRFKLELAGHGSARVNYWLAAGTSLREVLYIHKNIISQTIHKRFEGGCGYVRRRKWRSVSNRNIARRLSIVRCFSRRILISAVQLLLAAMARRLIISAMPTRTAGRVIACMFSGR